MSALARAPGRRAADVGGEGGEIQRYKRRTSIAEKAIERQGTVTVVLQLSLYFAECLLAYYELYLVQQAEADWNTIGAAFGSGESSCMLTCRCDGYDSGQVFAVCDTEACQVSCTDTQVGCLPSNTYASANRTCGNEEMCASMAQDFSAHAPSGPGGPRPRA